ncbi:MAG: DNA repair protein RecO [Bacteroidia bacterium]
MLVKTEGIVFQNTRYADKKLISKIYTRNFGLITVNAVAGSSPSSKIKTAVIQPLSQVEITLTLKQNREVQQLTEARSTYVYQHLQRDYNKLAIAQFLNEVLFKCIKEQSPNEALYDFIIQAYQQLDSPEPCNDFHIYVLMELSAFLGFEPHDNFDEQHKYFDTREGKFTPMALGFPVGFDQAQSLLFRELFDPDLLHKKFSAAQRGELLECLLAYYRMQVSGFNELRSYRVLKEIFA